MNWKRLPIACAAVIAMSGADNVSAQTPKRGAAAARTASEPPSETTAAGRIVSYSAKDVIRLKTKLRYTTLIVLPKNEQILEITCGDKELWVVNGTQNMAYVKPAKEGTQTNLNLVTARGNIYSFILTETSDAAALPDLKVFVEPKDDSAVAVTIAPPEPAGPSSDEYKRQIDSLKDELRRGRQESQAAIAANVRFSYRFQAGKKPFWVRAMYHDDRFTYIHARPEEAPALFEIKDGKPNVIHFDYRNGVYIATKVLDRGYLAVGKQKLEFVRQE